MQRVLQQSKKPRSHWEPRIETTDDPVPSLSPSQPSQSSSLSSPCSCYASSGRRHGATTTAMSTLYHSKARPSPRKTLSSLQQAPGREQVVVGLSASTDRDQVEDWTSDFLAAAAAAAERPRARGWLQRQDTAGRSTDFFRQSSSNSFSNGVAVTGSHRRGENEVGRESSGSQESVRRSIHGGDEDELIRGGLYSSYSSVKDTTRTGRTPPLEQQQHEDSSFDSDEDWDTEFGFDDDTDATMLESSDSMDPTRRRAENGNFFLPNLHKVLDGETLPDDDEMDGGNLNLDTTGRRPRRSSEEPIFQRRRNDLYQSGASVDGSLDGVRSSLTSASSSNAIEYSLVNKLRLLEVANLSAYAVRIERYPKPSTTFSNLEQDRTNFPHFTENRYERWLTDLVVPDCAVVSNYMNAERNQLPPPRQLKNQYFHALVSLPFGRAFVTTFFKQITHYRYFGDDKENCKLIRMYFEKVSTTGMTDENWAQKLSPSDLEFVVGCSVEILQEAARLYGPKSVVPLASHLSLSMLSASSPASSQGNKTTIYWIQQFQDILVHCAEAFPQYSNCVALIELRYVCHHLAGFASGEYDYEWQICNQLPAFLPLEPVVGDSASQIVNEVLQYYGALFQHLNTSPESRSNRYARHKSSGENRKTQPEDARHFALSSDALCLQALIMCDIQSLYDSKSALAEISLPALEELLEFEDDEATVDPALVGSTPYNRDSRSSSSSSSPDYRDSGYERGDVSKGLGGWSASTKLFELLRPSSRTRSSALSFFYERIAAADFPLVKAKCATVLAGMHVSSITSHCNSRVAESLAYEALRLLESCSKKILAKLSKTPSSDSRQSATSVTYLSIFNNYGLLSDLGRETLEGLGNILIKNNKYRYGILCLEAAGALFTFLNQGCQYEKLDRLLCKLTLEADDVNRALPLHEKVTCAAQRQGNITVYVYLTQEMTKLWIREGNFTRAEEYLATSCQFLRDNTNLLPPHFMSSAINASYSSSEALSSRSGTMMTATSSSVSSSLSGSFHLSSRSTGNASEVDTWLNHDINLHLLVRDVYRSSGRCLEGMRVLEHLLNYSTRLPRGKRTQLRMLLAEDALKMRMLDTCRHMFSLMEREATAFCDRLQENIKGFSGPGSSSGTGPGTSSSGGGRSLGGMGSEARYCFDMSFTIRYIVCRVKLYLKLDDLSKAFAWLCLAHVKNDRDNIRKEAQLYVLDGKVFRAIYREHQERETELRRVGPTQRGHSMGSTFVGSVVSPAEAEEMLKSLGVSLYGLNKDEKQCLHDRVVQFRTCVRDVDKVEEQAQNAFWTAFDLYRLLDDSLYQLKVLLEIVAFMLAPIQRSFFALGSNQDDEMLKLHLHRQSFGKGSSALDPDDLGGDDTIEKTRKTLLEAQKLLRPALNLVEQVASPACFLQTLIFCSEVWVWLERIASYKSEKHLKEATAFWEEAVRTMKGVFFRRVAFHDIADAKLLHSSGFGNDFTMPYGQGPHKGRFCVVPILNFSEGFIVKLEAMTLQLIFTACQIQQFERVPDYVEETLHVHLDELLSARMCLSSIVHQLQTFRALQKSYKRLPPHGSTSSLAAAAAAVPPGSNVSVSSVSSNNSRSSSFSAAIPVLSPQKSGSGKQAATPSPNSAGVASGKRAGHKKNQSMSSISELLASNTSSPYRESSASYCAFGGLKCSATPRTGLASLSERPSVLPPPSTAAGKSGATSSGHIAAKKSGERKPRRYTRERSRSAPQPEVLDYSSSSPDLPLARTGDGPPHEGGNMPVLAESVENSCNLMKRTSSVKFIDLGDLSALPSREELVLGRREGFGRDEGSSSNGAIGLCDFDEVQSEKLWWIFNLWRDAKSKFVEGKIETSEFRSRNLRYLRTLLDAFDPQQIAVLYFGGIDNSSIESVMTPSGTQLSSNVNSGNPNGMLDFDVSRMNTHALIQDRQLVLSIGYEVAPEMRTHFGTHPKLQFKVFHVREGDTKAWRQEIPRPDWYLSEYDIMEAEEAAVGAGVLRTMRLLGAKLLVKLLGMLILENSVVVVGSSYLQIQETTKSLLKLLEPFRWQHTFLPFVPVASWRFLYDAAYQHAQAEFAARPKSRRSFSRLSHDWRAWGSGSSYSSSRGSTDSYSGGGNSPSASGVATAPMEEEPPFLLGATAETWQSCLAFSKKCGNDPRQLSSCVVVVDLDDVDSLAADKTLRNAIPLPKKWRRQFLERIEKVTRQRHKMRVKMIRRHSSQHLVSSRGPATPASTSGISSRRSPVGTYPPIDIASRGVDDVLSTSQSGSSWMMTPVSGSEASESDSNYRLLQSGVQPTNPKGLDERKYYDSECAAAFVSGVREFYDRLLALCAEKERKAQAGKKKIFSSSGHSKRQEIKSWFSSFHDFDAFVNKFESTDLLKNFEKEKEAAQEEARTQARAMHLLERQSSEHEVSSTSSGRSTMRFGATPKSLANSFTPQQLKSFGSFSSFSSLTASNRSLGGQERRR